MVMFNYKLMIYFRFVLTDCQLLLGNLTQNSPVHICVFFVVVFFLHIFTCACLTRLVKISEGLQTSLILLSPISLDYDVLAFSTDACNSQYQFLQPKLQS